MPSISLPPYPLFPFSAAQVYHDHLDPADVARLTKGVQLVRQIFGSAPLADYVEQEVAPGNETTSDQEIEQYVSSGHLPRAARIPPGMRRAKTLSPPAPRGA